MGIISTGLQVPKKPLKTKVSWALCALAKTTLQHFRNEWHSKIRIVASGNQNDHRHCMYTASLASTQSIRYDQFSGYAIQCLFNGRCCCIGTGEAEEQGK